MLNRYTWEDSLVEAEAIGALAAGPVNTALRLARVINWCPNDNRPSGLYWKNELAADVVSVSRATLFRNIKVLKAAGFLIEQGGNLLPVLPESHNETREAYQSLVETLKERHQSHSETGKSQSETTESHNETAESQSDNPYSEDTYSEDTYSEDLLSEEVDSEDPGLSLDLVITDPFLCSLVETSQVVVITGEVPQSHNETGEQKGLESPENYGPSQDTGRVTESATEAPSAPKDLPELEEAATETGKDKQWPKELVEKTLDRMVARRLAGDRTEPYALAIDANCDITEDEAEW